MRNRLKNWKNILPLLPDPKMRPNDFQVLVLTCLNNGMSVRDATRVFGLAEKTVSQWREQFTSVDTENDERYFMKRARELGADDETLAHWFGFERVDKVTMLLADK